MTVAQLFGAAGLSPFGPVAWGTPCDERVAGVYAVVIDDDVVYIGRAGRSLRRRLGEFYRHRYGDRRPHRGGQELLKMSGVREIFWCATNDARGAETQMLRAFEAYFQRLPTANRRRGDRALTPRV
jgi:hypothetical protein